MVHGTTNPKNRRVFRYANRASGGAGELQTVHDLRVAAAVPTETGTIVYIYIYILSIY